MIYLPQILAFYPKLWKIVLRLFHKNYVAKFQMALSLFLLNCALSQLLFTQQPTNLANKPKAVI